MSRLPTALPAMLESPLLRSVISRSTLVAALVTTLYAPAGSSAAEETVAIINSHYKPASVTVSLGDTVTWVNQGFVLHNVTAENGEFASSTLHGGQKFSVKFTKPGTFDYSCTIHPQMTGKVIVTDRPSGAGSEGTDSPAPVPVPRTSPPAGTARVSLRLVRTTRGGKRMTRVLISSTRPHGEVLLQLYSREHFAWIQVAHATLNGTGGVTFDLRAGLHRNVRAVVLGGSGEGPSISSSLRS
jgi:plastocyanin